jgi:hypothetical protein
LQPNVKPKPTATSVEDNHQNSDQIQKYKKAYIKQQARYHSVLREIREANQSIEIQKQDNKKMRDEANLVKDLLLKEQLRNYEL